MVKIEMSDAVMKRDPHINEVREIVKPVRKDFGIFFTPDWVVDFMMGLIAKDLKDRNTDRLNLLEPASGMAQFLNGFKRNYEKEYNKSHRLGVEINRDIYEEILKPDADIIYSDFLLWETEKRFDFIIGNPPYGIPSLSDHYSIKIGDDTKSEYKKRFSTWYGKYNVYGAFIEKAIQILSENGILLFIIPATFLILDEFRKLREYLASNGETNIIYMGEDVFKPHAYVTSVVLKFKKSIKKKHYLSLYELKDNKLILEDKKDEQDCLYHFYTKKDWIGNPITFLSRVTEVLESICRYRIGDVFDVSISPRTPEIKKNLYIVRDESLIDESYIPILSGVNLKQNSIVYEPLNKHWIKKKHVDTLRKYFHNKHIVIGHGFRGSKNLAVAYDEKAYPWMGDVYHLFRINIFDKVIDVSDEEIVRYLGSEIVSKYINDKFRDVTFHLSKSQINEIPLIATEDEISEIQNAIG